MVYAFHSIEWSRLCKRDQTVYDQLKELTKGLEGLTDGEVQQMLKQRQPKQKSKTQSHASSRGPEAFDISDDDLDAEEPTSVPFYDPTDDSFNVLQRILKQEDIDKLRKRCSKTIRLARHLQTQPNDADAKADRMFYKEGVGRATAEPRLRRKELDLDDVCMTLLDDIEKDVCISHRTRKKNIRDTMNKRVMCRKHDANQDARYNLVPVL